MNESREHDEGEGTSQVVEEKEVQNVDLKVIEKVDHQPN